MVTVAFRRHTEIEGKDCRRPHESCWLNEVKSRRQQKKEEGGTNALCVSKSNRENDVFCLAEYSFFNYNPITIYVPQWKNKDEIMALEIEREREKW